LCFELGWSPTDTQFIDSYRRSLAKASFYERKV